MTISVFAGAAAVANDQTGPVVVPDVLRPTICQKCVLLARSAS
jgi:hypothetical protein